MITGRNRKNRTGCTGTCLTCTGTCSVLEGCTGTCSRCTSTFPPKMPRMCIFLPFFHIFDTQFNPILYKHVKTTPNSSYNLISTQFIIQYISFIKTFHDVFCQNNSNMGHNPYINQIQGFIRVCSNPTPLLYN